MRNTAVVRSLVTAMVICSSAVSFAQNRLKTSCHMDPQGNIKGSNLDSMVEIASVSKMITSHWAITKLGARYRYQTIVHLTPVSQGVVDLHLEGGLDPSFNASRLALLIAELNVKGVNTIRSFTFDNNFRYRNSIYSGDVVASNPTYYILGPNGTMVELRRAVTQIKAFYDQTRRQLGSRINSLALPKTVNMTVDNIEFKDKANFVKSESTQSFSSRSIELFKILKELNVVSNNYLANIVFSHLGSPADYAEFISKDLGLDSTKIRMINGSGYPDTSSGLRVDNKATCRSIVKIAKDLRETLNSESFVFADVIAMAGVERRATVTKVYNSEKISSAVVAKTGTADPVVSLAGLASTQEGIIYFGIVVSDGTTPRAGSGRTIIREELESLMKAYRGKKSLEAGEDVLFPADNGSLLSSTNATETETLR